MVRGISDLFVALAFLPLPVVVGIGVAGAVVALPMWLESIRAKQIRGMVRRMVRADPPERQRLSAEVFRLAGVRARRLVLLAESAVKYDQRSLREAAVAALEASGGDPRDVQRLREVDRKPEARVVDPLAAAVRVEQLLDDGLVVAAREHLTAARRAFPADAELRALEERLDLPPERLDPPAAEASER
jgi:hypothetical protein